MNEAWHPGQRLRRLLEALSREILQATDEEIETRPDGRTLKTAATQIRRRISVALIAEWQEDVLTRSGRDHRVEDDRPGGVR